MLFFVDESGIDLHEAPCSVLAAVSFSESTSWDFARAFSDLKRQILRFDDPDEYDAKGSKLLKRRVFQQAASVPAISSEQRADTIDALLEKNARGQQATPFELAALAQAKLEFVEQALHLAKASGVATFASIVPRDVQQLYSRREDADFLRKDWA